MQAEAESHWGFTKLRAPDCLKIACVCGLQRDRWEEGHDPEFFNLRRKTSKEDAIGSTPPPPQYVASMRDKPKAQNALPKAQDAHNLQPLGELPPHLLHKVRHSARQARSRHAALLHLAVQAKVQRLQVHLHVFA